MNESKLIVGELPLSAAQRLTLRCLLGEIIPASASYGIPGADDAAIFADVLATSAPHAAQIIDALQQLDTLAGGSFADLDAADRRRTADAFHAQHAVSAGLIAALAVQCYYRDDRVMRSLGMEARPPFPKGFAVEAGDWSLLDPVRAKSKLYRDAP